MRLNSEILFWLSWVIIPLVVEIIPSIGNFFLLLRKYFFKKQDAPLVEYPEISLIIPVYNSADTLEKCIRSVEESSYDSSRITIMLVDNGSRDNSFEVFQRCQIEYPELSMYWFSSNQGKSKALNKALFNCHGKYVMNIDSDGRLEKDALLNVVKRFESHPEIHCLTGTILTERDEIDATKKWGLRVLRKMEYIEYCHSFLAGRNYDAEKNRLFTISGAFSAFRKSAIMQTFMYNTDTICEDAHMTFQIKRRKKKVSYCENAIFYVSPIDDGNKLYTQRQRWQIGELEVYHIFFKNALGIHRMYKDSSFGTLLVDHTFAFPRLIWYFALVALTFFGYNLRTTVLALLLIYALYVLSAFLYYINIALFLKNYKEDKRYYMRKILYLFAYPFYNLYTFVLRFMGIINSIRREPSWKTYSFKEEMKIAGHIIRDDALNVLNIFKKRQRGLSRFVEPQNEDFDIAVMEIKSGRKKGNYMAYMFPQIQGMNRGYSSKVYSIRDIDEARQFVDDPVLGENLLRLTRTLYDSPTTDPVKIFGEADSARLKSSMTMFMKASPQHAVFKDVLDKFYGGETCDKTLELLERKEA